jgi:hypothetical protein
MKRRLKQAFIDSDQRKSIDVLNMQLRVACIDDQLHAVRYLLEEGADPFQIVSGINSTPCYTESSFRNLKNTIVDNIGPIRRENSTDDSSISRQT